MHPRLFAIPKPDFWEQDRHGINFQVLFPAQSRKKWEGRRKSVAPLCISLPCVQLISTGMCTATDGTSRIMLCIQPTESDLNLRLLGSAGFAEVGGEEPAL